MIDTIIGIVLITLGILWLRHQIKKPMENSNIEQNPTRWTYKIKGFIWSILTILFGIMFLLKEISYSMLF